MTWEKRKTWLWKWRCVWTTIPGMAVLIIFLRWLGLFQSWEWAAYDQYMRWRPSEPVDNRIVIVGINEQDVKYLNEGNTNDATLAKLINKLKQQKPRAIGLDIYRDVPYPPGHEELVKVFNSTENLIGIEKLVGKKAHEIIAPPPVLKKLGQVGSNDMIVDGDNTMRRGLLILDDSQGNVVYGLALFLTLIYLQKEGIEIKEIPGTENFQLGKAIISRFQPNDGSYIRANSGGYQLLINYRGKKGHFRQVSLKNVLEDEIPKNWARDRIIIIGKVGASFNDFNYTPYSAVEGLLATPDPMSGVEIQANFTSQLISAALDNRSFIKSWPEPIEYLWILLWSGIGTLLTWHWRYKTKSNTNTITNTKDYPKHSIFKSTYWQRGISIFIAQGILITSTYIAFIYGWWLPVVTPFLALTGAAISITAYIAHTADSIRKIFGRYLTEEVVAKLLESPEGLKLGGKRETITVLTSDLRGFTALSELLSPEMVVQILNIYLEYMLNDITLYQGTIDKFMGDGIVVLFGAPTTRKDDAARAVACAIVMQITMKKVNNKLEKLGLPMIEMGIGVNTGEVVVGNIGSEKHTEYTVIGKEMNLAFRIETYSLGGQVLISESTLEAVGESNLIINLEKQIQPKGLKEPITIYDIVGIKEPYNLLIEKDPDTELYIELKQPIPVQYCNVDGKQVGNKVNKGYIVKLSSKGAGIIIDAATESYLPMALSNIKLNLLYDHDYGVLDMSDDIYAKVLDKTGFGEICYVWFTFKPPTVAKRFLQLLSGI